MVKLTVRPASGAAPEVAVAMKVAGLPAMYGPGADAVRVRVIAEVRLTLAAAVMVGSAVLTAVTVRFWFAAMLDGAVYTPEALMVPAAPVLRFQVTGAAQLAER